jgi:hypothetical protein
METAMQLNYEPDVCPHRPPPGLHDRTPRLPSQKSLLADAIAKVARHRYACDIDHLPSLCSQHLTLIRREVLRGKPVNGEFRKRRGGDRS